MRRWIALMAVACLSGCGGASGPAAPDTTAPTPPSAAPLAPLSATLVGTWRVSITPAEQAAAEARIGRSLAGNAGAWQLTLAADGSYVLDHVEDEPFTEQGQAGTAADTLTLRVTSFSAHATCHGNFPVGSSQRYRFAADADTLTLGSPDSACPDDVLILGTKPLQRLR